MNLIPGSMGLLPNNFLAPGSGLGTERYQAREAPRASCSQKDHRAHSYGKVLNKYSVDKITVPGQIKANY